MWHGGTPQRQPGPKRSSARCVVRAPTSVTMYDTADCTAVSARRGSLAGLRGRQYRYQAALVAASRKACGWAAAEGQCKWPSRSAVVPG